MHTPAVVAPFLAFALAALTAAPSGPRFAPEEGSEVAKTFVHSMSMKSTSVKGSIGDQDLPPEALGSFELSMSSKMTVEVADRYVKVGDGRPLVLERKFVELGEEGVNSQTAPGMPEPKEEQKTKASALEGRSVRFRWSEDEDEYATGFVGEEGDAALLEGLEEDLDLRLLLPGRKVEVGDEWEVDGHAFGALFEPGGDLHLVKAGGDAEEDESDFGDQITANMKGKAQLRFAEVRKVEGRELAVITVRAELESRAESDRGQEGKLRVEARFDLEGELLWSLEQGRFEELELSGGLEFDMQVEQQIDMGGATHTLLLEFALEGETSLAAKTGG